MYEQGNSVLEKRPTDQYMYLIKGQSSSIALKVLPQANTTGKLGRNFVWYFYKFFLVKHVTLSCILLVLLPYTQSNNQTHVHVLTVLLYHQVFQLYISSTNFPLSYVFTIELAVGDDPQSQPLEPPKTVPSIPTEEMY